MLERRESAIGENDGILMHGTGDSKLKQEVAHNSFSLVSVRREFPNRTLSGFALLQGIGHLRDSCGEKNSPTTLLRNCVPKVQFKVNGIAEGSVGNCQVTIDCHCEIGTSCWANEHCLSIYRQLDPGCAADESYMQRNHNHKFTN